MSARIRANPEPTPATMLRALRTSQQELKKHAFLAVDRPPPVRKAFSDALAAVSRAIRAGEEESPRFGVLVNEALIILKRAQDAERLSREAELLGHVRAGAAP